MDQDTASVAFRLGYVKPDPIRGILNDAVR